MRNWAIVLNNTIVNRVLWDGATEWHYELPHDEIIEDKDNNLAIGMIRNENGIWYFPEPGPVNE